MTRLTSKTYSVGNTQGSVTYEYLDHQTDTNRTTGVVGSITYFGSGALTLAARYYDYDANGNITREYRGLKTDSKVSETYTYDSKNQLVRHDSKSQNKSFTYTYDNAGNILSKSNYAYTIGNLGTATGTINYAYQSTDGWGDKLTIYNSKAITYDQIGNMLSYDGKTYTWQGRELSQITSGSTTYSYKYNADGIRTEKIVNGTKTEYFLNGSRILAQTTNGETMWFFYDSQGSRVGLVQGDATYYYMYNVQGDVVGLVDAETGSIVATYEYDAWGKCTAVTNATGYTVGTDNPFRYRGYYYDSETGLYYVSSRYYDPEIGRFISADTENLLLSNPAGLSDKNLYAYCDNDPINRLDEDGDIWHIVVGGIVGGFISGIVKVSSNIAQGKKATEGLGIALLAGAASGALAATGVGLIGIAAGNTVISMAESAVNQYSNSGSVNIGETLFDGAVGGIIGSFGGKGTGTKQLNDLGKQIIKRTSNAVEHKGLKSGFTELKKASIFYVKSTRGYYNKQYSLKPIKWNVIGSGVNAAITSEYMKGQYVHWIGR